MGAPQPVTCYSEIFELVQMTGLKDLSVFGKSANRRLTLRRNAEQLLNSSETLAEGHAALGLLASYENKGDDALKHFKAAHNLMPNSAHTVNYGLMLQTSGDLDQALKYLRPLLDKNPSDAYMLELVGKNYLRTFNFNAFDDLLQNLPSFDSTANVKAVLMSLRNIQQLIYNFLASRSLDLKQFASLDVLSRKFFYEHFTNRTELLLNPWVNHEGKQLVFEINISKWLDPEQAADFNDKWQDRLIDWMYEAPDARRPLLDRVSMYFINNGMTADVA